MSTSESSHDGKHNGALHVHAISILDREMYRARYSQGENAQEGPEMRIRPLVVIGGPIADGAYQARAQEKIERLAPEQEPR
jgi:hypothetical protein